MSREYAYFDEARLKDQLQKSAVSAYCDGGSIETSPCSNALAIAGAILADDSQTSAFFERLRTITKAAVQAELNVAYAPEFQRLRKRAMAMDPPKQLVLNFARSTTSLVVKYMLKPAASSVLSKGLHIDHQKPSETATCLKFDDLTDVRQWLDRQGAQRHQIKNAAPAVDLAKSDAGNEGQKAAAPGQVNVELGDKHEAASLIKSLHQAGGQPLRRMQP